MRVPGNVGRIGDEHRCRRADVCLSCDGPQAVEAETGACFESVEGDEVGVEVFEEVRDGTLDAVEVLGEETPPRRDWVPEVGHVVSVPHGPRGQAGVTVRGRPLYGPMVYAPIVVSPSDS